MTIASNGFTNPMSVGDVRVTIIGTDTDTGLLIVRDAFANEFQIDGNNRLKGGGIPQPGEKWNIAKSAGQWYLKSQIGTTLVPTITGSRSGLAPIVSQILDALVLQGVVVDQTTAAPVDGPLADPIPYTVGDPDYVDPTLGEDPLGNVEENEGDADLPVYDGPSTTPTPAPPTPPKSTGAYTTKWVHLYAGTYNTLKDLGPRTAYQDLVKLTKTRLQIVGLQEAHGNERDPFFARLTAEHNWGVHRPKISAFSDEDTIIWDRAVFDLIDSGVQSLSTVDVPGMPPRYLVWVKVMFKPANRVMFYMSTHTDPHLDTTPYTSHHVGHPNFTEWQVRVEQSIVQINHMANTMRQFARSAPVFLAGDFNISATADARVRYSGFPYAKFGSVGAKSNWSSIHHKPHGPTHGQIDQIWLARGKDWQVQFVDHWGFAGYQSDHRPVMTQFMIRGKA